MRAKAQGKSEQKAKLATPIDPKVNPGWYLDDPTLRKGDIVVLKNKVLVFEGGGRAATISDFSSLGASRLVSKTDRARIESMAGLPPTTAVTAGSAQPAVDDPSTKPARATEAAAPSRLKEVSLRVGE